MRFIIYSNGNHTQVEEDALTRELLTNIQEEDAFVLYWNSATREYEEYNARTYVFESLETYSDDEEAEQQEHRRTLDGLLKKLPTTNL